MNALIKLAVASGIFAIGSTVFAVPLPEKLSYTHYSGFVQVQHAYSQSCKVYNDRVDFEINHGPGRFTLKRTNYLPLDLDVIETLISDASNGTVSKKPSFIVDAPNVVYKARVPQTAQLIVLSDWGGRTEIFNHSKEAKTLRELTDFVCKPTLNEMGAEAVRKYFELFPPNRVPIVRPMPN